MDFKDKRVLVTGGSRGIGKAVAQAFAAEGARVAVNFRSNQEAADRTVSELPGNSHEAIRADLTDPSQVEELIRTVADRFGGLDIVVNNAGISDYHRFEEMDYKKWQKVWEETLGLNLVGAANVCFCAAQHMKHHGGGRLVNISSRGAFRGEPEKPAYGASKAGLNALSQSLAQALAKHKIYVGVVAPGFVETDLVKDVLESPEGERIRSQSPLGRVARPEEVARAVLFLAAEGTEFMTGAIIDVNGASYLRS